MRQPALHPCVYLCETVISVSPGAVKASCEESWAGIVAASALLLAIARIVFVFPDPNKHTAVSLSIIREAEREGSAAMRFAVTPLGAPNSHR